MSKINVFSLKYVKDDTISSEVGDVVIISPKLIYALMSKEFHLNEKTEEYLYILCRNCQGAITDISEVAHGALDASLVAPREIFKRAIIANACSIIVCHNHPSGTANPSKADIAITQELQKAGELLNLPIVEHIIISYDDYFSFRTHGLLNE